jgi:hypothetical protein
MSVKKKLNKPTINSMPTALDYSRQSPREHVLLRPQVKMRVVTFVNRKNGTFLTSFVIFLVYEQMYVGSNEMSISNDATRR